MKKGSLRVLAWLFSLGSSRYHILSVKSGCLPPEKLEALVARCTLAEKKIFLQVLHVIIACSTITIQHSSSSLKTKTHSKQAQHSLKCRVPRKPSHRSSSNSKEGQLHRRGCLERSPQRCRTNT